jgi:hypothetical protein
MGKVYKVWHTLRRAGKNVGHFTSDLIFLDEIPTIVFEWDLTSEGDVPGSDGGVGSAMASGADAPVAKCGLHLRA